MRLLLVEDDGDIGPALQASLARAGHAVDLAATLSDARANLEAARFDCVLLDLGLPDGDGRDLIADLRRAGEAVPILVISARDAVGGIADALNAGADDYVVKPVALVELEARLGALMRRPGIAGPRLTLANVTFDVGTREVTVGDVPLSLPRRELSLLEALLRRPNRVVTRDTLDNALYGLGDEVGPNALEAQVSRLRKRLAAAGARVEVRTVRGVGYVVCPEAEP
jgi:DNA-binding response OmpR family regulator